MDPGLLGCECGSFMVQCEICRRNRTYRYKSSGLCAGQRVPQPRTRKPPITSRGPVRHPHCLCGFFDAQPAKESQFDQFGRLRIFASQFSQALVNIKQSIVVCFCWQTDLPQIDALQAAAVSASRLSTGMINKNASHGFGGGAEEVRAILEVMIFG